MSIGLYKYVLLLSVLFIACNNELSYPEYLKFISEKNNGFVVSEKVGDIELTMKNLPADYLAMKDHLNSPNESFDSMKDYHSKGLTFFLNIKSVSKKKLIFTGVDDFGEYKVRNNDLFFNIQEYLYMSNGEDRINPTIVNVEQDFGLSSEIGYYIVFEKPDVVKKNIEVVYDDVFFESGISHFPFDWEKINKKIQVNYETKS